MSELVRANRVSVQAEVEGYVATFYRTHKVVATVNSTATPWVADPSMNRTAQREAFRTWTCTNANTLGIAYDPVDRRDESNQMPAKYTSDELLLTTASKLVDADVREWVAKASKEWNIPVEIMSIEGEEIVPVTMRGTKEVSPKYGNGNWAWAIVKVLVTVQSGDVQGYATLECSLVSGQLKKPASIGELGYTFTGLKTEIGKDLELVIKAQESTKEESKPVEEKTETPTPSATEESKTKKSRSKSKKADAQ